MKNSNADMYELVKKIRTKDDFEEFLFLLLQDFIEKKEEWRNSDLQNYLNALHTFCIDMEGYYVNKGEKFDESKPSWKNFAHMLLAAIVYE